jgi:hypothetical protein
LEIEAIPLGATRTIPARTVRMPASPIVCVLDESTNRPACTESGVSYGNVGLSAFASPDALVNGQPVQIAGGSGLRQESDSSARKRTSAAPAIDSSVTTDLWNRAQADLDDQGLDDRADSTVEALDRIPEATRPASP